MHSLFGSIIYCCNMITKQEFFINFNAKYILQYILRNISVVCGILMYGWSKYKFHNFALTAWKRYILPINLFELFVVTFKFQNSVHECTLFRSKLIMNYQSSQILFHQNTKTSSAMVSILYSNFKSYYQGSPNTVVMISGTV